MSDLELLNQLKSLKGLKNQSETSSFESNLPEAGKAPARFIGYVEMGTHAQPDYQGQSKAPAKELRLMFEVFGSKNTREIEVEGVKKKVGAMLEIRLTEKLNDRAKFMKLFKNMTYGRKDITHLTHMLDEVFLVTIRHYESKTTKKKYATIQSEDGTYNIGRPFMDQADPDSGEIIGEIDLTPKTPPRSGRLRGFVVDDPTIEQWESIKIDGTYKKKVKTDDGEDGEQEVSKNFLQETIMLSLDWKDSAMRKLLIDAGEYSEEDDAALALLSSSLEEEEDDGSEPEPLDIPEDKKPVEKKPATVKAVASKDTPAPAATASSTSVKKTTATPAKGLAAVVAEKKKEEKPKPVSKKEIDQGADDELAALGL